MRLIKNYKGLFSDIPRKSIMAQHDVDIDEEIPVKQHPYRMSSKKTKQLEKEIQYMLTNGIIEHGRGEKASPCVLVDEPEGTVTFCTDYWKVNRITRMDVCPIPRIEDCIYRIGKAKYITKYDLFKRYRAILLKERAKEISSFVTPQGNYKYCVMPLEMKIHW